jgi:uncharacterized protein YndB with AHSA1/START domain
MDIDVEAHFGAVFRELEIREHQGQPARAVIATRSYDTDIHDLWDALTNGERLLRWFLPVSGDLRLGGRYQLEGNAGGTIEACEPPRLLGLTWEMRGATSWVRVQLSEEGAERTRFELEHISLVADLDPSFWDQYGPGAVGVGWDLALIGLALHIATGATLNAQEFQGWTVGEEGKRFVRLSSDDWARASIAAGTDESAARGAAARTTAFYTGEPAPEG